MIRVRSPRSVCAMITSRLADVKPVVRKRSSPSEYRGSSTVRASGSPKAVDPSANETPCFSWLMRSFSGSHSNSTDSEVYRGRRRKGHVLAGAGERGLQLRASDRAVHPPDAAVCCRACSNFCPPYYSRLVASPPLPLKSLSAKTFATPDTFWPPDRNCLEIQGIGAGRSSGVRFG